VLNWTEMERLAVHSPNCLVELRFGFPAAPLSGKGLGEESRAWALPRETYAQMFNLAACIATGIGHGIGTELRENMPTDNGRRQD
jgi:hypothetical protein